LGLVLTISFEQRKYFFPIRPPLPEAFNTTIICWRSMLEFSKCFVNLQYGADGKEVITIAILVNLSSPKSTLLLKICNFGVLLFSESTTKHLLSPLDIKLPIFLGSTTEVENTVLTLEICSKLKTKDKKLMKSNAEPRKISLYFQYCAVADFWLKSDSTPVFSSI
jgi:hypothetical protein